MGRMEVVTSSGNKVNLRVEGKEIASLKPNTTYNLDAHLLAGANHASAIKAATAKVGELSSIATQMVAAANPSFSSSSDKKESVSFGFI